MSSRFVAIWLVVALWLVQVSAETVNSFNQLAAAISTASSPTIIYVNQSFGFPQQIVISPGQDISIIGAVFDVNLYALTQNRLFAVNSSASLRIENLFLSTSILEKTLGSGGIVLVNKGSLIVNSSTLSGGSTDCGSAIYAEHATINVADSSIQDNHALGSSSCGGAIYGSYSTISISDSSIVRNTASIGAGINSFHSNVSIHRSAISNNRATGLQGGSLFVYSSNVVVEDSSFFSDAVEGNGGSVAVFQGSVVQFANCTFENSNSTALGGTMYIQSSDVSMTGCLLENSEAETGGAIYLSGGTLNLTSSTLRANHATTSGGGVSCANGGVVVVSNVSFIENIAETSGGGLDLLECATTVSRSTFSDHLVYLTGTSTSIGGDMNCQKGSLTVTSSTFSGSSAGEGASVYSFYCALSMSDVLVENSAAENSIIYNGDQSTVALSQITLRNNSGSSGSGGVVCVDTLSCDVASSVFESSSSAEFGVLFVDNSPATIVDCEFSLNSANGAGGAVFVREASSVLVQRCVFAENSATTFGAAITADIRSHITITDSQFVDNVASAGGAIYAFSHCTVEVANCSFSRNFARDSGGSVYSSSNTRIVLRNSTISHSSAPYGGVLYASSGTSVHIADCVALSNSAGFAGGVVALFDDSQLVVNSTVLRNNSASLGGAISVQYMSYAALQNVTCMDNSASNYGGVVYVEVTSTLSMSQCTLNGNTANYGGGALLLQSSTAEVSDSTFLNHVATSGGAIHSIGSTLTISSCDFASNGFTAYAGGAVYLVSGSVLRSFYSNFAADKAQLGGALYMSGSAFYSSGDTLSACVATIGACIYSTEASTLQLTHSTVQRNNHLLISPGVIFLESGNFSSFHSVVSANKVQTLGAVCIFAAEVLIVNSTFSSNSAVGNAALGAALYMGCTSPCVAQVNALVRDSVFQSNSAPSGFGAAINVLNFPGVINITGCNFSSNYAQNGGAISSSGSLVLVSRSQFLRNQAVQGGGGIFWTYSDDDEQVSVDFNSIQLGGNVAGYGSFVATSLVSIHVDTEDANSSAAQVSGSALAAPVAVTLRDFYQQTIVNSSLLSSTMSTVYCNVFNNSGVIRGSSIVLAESGVATFSQLVVVGKPGGAIQLEFSVPVTTVSPQFYQLPLRTCQPGEITVPQDDGLSTCQRCDAGTYSFDPSESVCYECPSHATCPGGDQLDVESGYWRVNDVSASVLRCAIPGACLGGVNTSTQCREGQEGPYCSVCQPGYAQSSNGLCYSCSNSDSMATEAVSTVLFVVVLAALAVLVKYSKKILKWYGKMVDKAVKNRKFRTLRVKGKILVAFAQIVFQMGPAFNVVFPVSFIQYLNYYSIFQLNLVFLPDVGCLVSTNYYDDLLISTISPFILYTVIVVALQAMVVHARRLNERNPYYTSTRALSDTFTAAFVISYFVLISVSTKIFEVFQCETFDDGSSYLVADYSIDCNASDRNLYVTYGSIMIFVYPVGIPVAYALVLWNYHDRINPHWSKVIDEKEIEFVSNHVVQQEKIKVRRTYPEIRNISLLYDSYTPQHWYFEVFDCGRRLMLGAIPVLILRGSSLQIVIVLLVSLGSVAVFMHTQPYIHRHDSQLAILAQWSITLVIISALVIKVQAVDNQSSGLGIVLIVLNVAVIFVSLASTIINSSVTREDMELEQATNDGGSSKAAATTHKRKRARPDSVARDGEADESRPQSSRSRRGSGGEKKRLSSDDDGGANRSDSEDSDDEVDDAPVEPRPVSAARPRPQTTNIFKRAEFAQNTQPPAQPAPSEQHDSDLGSDEDEDDERGSFADSDEEPTQSPVARTPPFVTTNPLHSVRQAQRGTAVHSRPTDESRGDVQLQTFSTNHQRRHTDTEIDSDDEM